MVLFADLLKQTPKSNPDHVELERALLTIKDVMTHINEDKRRTEGQVHSDCRLFSAHWFSAGVPLGFGLLMDVLGCIWVHSLPILLWSVKLTVLFDFGYGVRWVRMGFTKSPGRGGAVDLW